MTDISLLVNLGAMIIAAAVVIFLLRRFRVPTIIAYIIAGLVLGPISGLVDVSEAIEIISEVGIVLLLFLVGLELSFDKIRDVGRVAVVAGIGQVVFTALGGFGISMLLGFSVVESVFISTALTFSSTVVVVKLLDEKKEIHDLYGRIAVGIFLVQDLVVVIALTFLAGLAGGDEMEAAGIAGNLGLAFAGMGLLLGIVLLASRYILPTVFRWISILPGAMFIWSLCWCFLIVLGAEAMNLSPEIGAFLAGISLAQLPYNHDLRRRVHPLMNFFIAVFFVSLGIQMEMDAAAAHWASAIVLSLFVLIGNPFIFMWIISQMGYAERTSFLTSVTVAQISEFSFIFAALGLASGLIDQTILSLIAVVGLVTIGVSAYMILYNHQLYEIVRRRSLLKMFRATQEEAVEEKISLTGHIIVVGVNALSRRIIHALHEAGEALVVIDVDPRKLVDVPCHTILGNAEYASVLEEAQLDHAKLLISALQIEEMNKLLAYRSQEAGVPASIHAFDQSLIHELQAYGADHLMSSKSDGIRKFVEGLRREGVIN